MRIRRNDPLTAVQKKIWLKKLAWALPLFFLMKGLFWLSIPVVLAVYGLN